MSTLDLALGACWLGLYLLAVRVMAGALDRSLGGWLRPYLARATESGAGALALGVVLALPSSTVALTAIVALLAAGLLSFDAAFLVMLGSTVGAVARLWLPMLSIDALGPALVAVASFALVGVRHPRAQHAWQAALGLGLAFTSLHLLAATLALGPLPGLHGEKLPKPPPACWLK